MIHIASSFIDIMIYKDIEKDYPENTGTVKNVVILSPHFFRSVRRETVRDWFSLFFQIPLPPFLKGRLILILKGKYNTNN